MSGDLTFHMNWCLFELFDVNLWVDDGIALSAVNKWCIWPLWREWMLKRTFLVRMDGKIDLRCKHWNNVVFIFLIESRFKNVSSSFFSAVEIKNDTEKYQWTYCRSFLVARGLPRMEMEEDWLKHIQSKIVWENSPKGEIWVLGIHFLLYKSGEF